MRERPCFSTLLFQKVFCGHEYSIKNLKFALKVEPDNEKVKEMLSWARVSGGGGVFGSIFPCLGPTSESNLSHSQDYGHVAGDGGPIRRLN